MDATSTLSAPWFTAQADDLLPKARANAPRRVTDAELVTLCVAGDHRHPLRSPLFGGPRNASSTCSPTFRASRPTQAPPPPGRRHRVAHRRLPPQPGFANDLLLSTRRRSVGRSGRPPCARRLARSPATATARLIGFFSGLRLHGLFALDGTPRALELADPARDEREVALEPVGAPCAAASCCSATRATPARPSPRAPRHSASPWYVPSAATARRGAHLAPIRQRIESIFWTAKDLLTLERHGARTMAGLRERVLQQFLCLAACISLNHRLGRPSRSLVSYCA